MACSVKNQDSRWYPCLQGLNPMYPASRLTYKPVVASFFDILPGEGDCPPLRKSSYDIETTLKIPINSSSIFGDNIFINVPELLKPNTSLLVSTWLNVVVFNEVVLVSLANHLPLMNGKYAHVNALFRSYDSWFLSRTGLKSVVQEQVISWEVACMDGEQGERLAAACAYHDWLLDEGWDSYAARVSRKYLGRNS